MGCPSGRLLTTNSDNTINITGYAGTGGVVTIPGTLFGMPVSSIGAAAFANCAILTSVTIPSSITNIGDSAFVSCANLMSVLFQGNAPSLGGSNVFQGDSNATTYYLTGATGWGISFGGLPAALMPYMYTINNGTITITGYIGNGGPATIPGTLFGLPVRNIGNSAFQNNSFLTSVAIPDSVTNIGNSAFSGCSYLTNVILGAGITSIGSSAFACCYDLTSITIPNSVTIIGSSAFNSCTSLTNVNFGLNVTAIGDYAFACCNFTRVTIPNCVTQIGNYAFEFDPELKTLTIGSGVASLGNWAFYWCYQLQNVYFKGNAPLGNSTVFFGDTDANVYCLPETTGWNSFAGPAPILWNPRALNDNNFGVHTGHFGFTISGPADVVVIVEACTNLTNSGWTPVSTNTLTGGRSYFSDPQWTNYPSRFYRFSAP